jgi:hypothetical protein
MRKAIDGQPEEHVLNVDADDWAKALAHHFVVGCPVLTDEVWQSQWQETTMDVRGDHMRDFGPRRQHSAMNYRAYSTVIHVGYKGEHRVFSLRPNRFSTIWPIGWVTDTAVCDEIVWPGTGESPVDSLGERFIELVEKYLGFAREEIDAYNVGFEQKARGWIESRRTAIDKRKAEQGASKFPCGAAMRQPV